MLNPTRRDEVEELTSVDGSRIRELAHPRSSEAARQSLAEATVPPGSETRAHLHREAEEIYSFIAGSGRMRLGDAEGPVGAGETVVIPPGTAHKLWNDGAEPLILLCCCSPPYSDGDTVVLEGG